MKETSGPTCNARCITQVALRCEENALPCCSPGIEATSLVGGSTLWDAGAPHATDTCTNNRVATPLPHNSDRTSRIHEILGAPIRAKKQQLKCRRRRLARRWRPLAAWTHRHRQPQAPPRCGLSWANSAPHLFYFLFSKILHNSRCNRIIK